MAWAEAVLTHQMNVGHIWRGKATFQKHCHTHTFFCICLFELENFAARLHNKSSTAFYCCQLCL